MKRLLTSLLAASAVLLVSACQKVERIELTPAKVALGEAGQSTTLQARAVTDKGEPVEKATFEFASSDAKVATVDASGKVSAVKSGSATITVKSAEVSASAPVEVSIPSAIVIKNAPGTLTGLGSEAVLEAEVRDDAGRALPEARLEYAAADTTVVAVEGNRLTARAVGSTVVTATSGKLKQDIPISVKLPEVASVAFVDALPATLKVGESASVTAVAKGGNGTDIQGMGVTFSSSDEKLATVDATGKVTAVKPGAVTIKAESGGKTAEAQVTIKKK